MYVRTAVECESCRQKGFLGKHIDVNMLHDDYRLWDVIIHTDCPHCKHQGWITLSDIAKMAQTEKQREASYQTALFQEAEVAETPQLANAT